MLENVFILAVQTWYTVFNFVIEYWYFFHLFLVRLMNYLFKIFGNEYIFSKLKKKNIKYLN